MLIKDKMKIWRVIKKEFRQKRLILDPEFLWIAAIFMIVLEIIINYLVIDKALYTEIDWKAYMQEVEGVVNGTYDYTQLKGDTGPLVYPGGFVAVFVLLYYLTSRGTDLQTAQYIFALIYIVTLILVFRIYAKTKKIPPYVLVFICCASYRIHSIYVLRLFNDPVAMLLLYAAINCFLDTKWTLGCILYSLAVSVKMNVLLFAPALLILLLKVNGLKKTFWNLFTCATVQITVGFPFLMTNPLAYITQAFNLGRIFLYEWTVNWRFLPEEVFVSRYFHVTLLLIHIISIIMFAFKWKRYVDLFSWIPEKQPSQVPLCANQIIWPLFTANFIGVAFSRSLHYQFYVWYFHSLPYLLWSTAISPVSKLCILGTIELTWNTYPSTDLSSLLLHVCHFIILCGVWIHAPGKEPKELLKKEF